MPHLGSDRAGATAPMPFALTSNFKHIDQKVKDTHIKDTECQRYLKDHCTHAWHPQTFTADIVRCVCVPPWQHSQYASLIISSPLGSFYSKYLNLAVDNVISNSLVFSSKIYTPEQTKTECFPTFSGIPETVWFCINHIHRVMQMYVSAVHVVHFGWDVFLW